jgi:two-component system, response regulator / RNA-binding antiterminator
MTRRNCSNEVIDPDVILIDLESPSRDVLEQMFKVSRSVARPVAMFVDRSDAETIDAAIDAGVSTYIVDGLRKDRVKPILDMNQPFQCIRQAQERA